MQKAGALAIARVPAIYVFPTVKDEILYHLLTTIAPLISYLIHSEKVRLLLFAGMPMNIRLTITSECIFE